MSVKCGNCLKMGTTGGRGWKWGEYDQSTLFTFMKIE
jgi:hypothetical protein